MAEQAMKNTGSNDFLTGKIKPLYFKYLTAAFGLPLSAAR